MSKNLLSENMLRFGTKNLSEGSKRNLVLESVMQTIKEHGLTTQVYHRLLEFNPMTAGKEFMDKEMAKAKATNAIAVYDYSYNEIIATGPAVCTLYNKAYPVPGTSKTVVMYQIKVPIIDLRQARKNPAAPLKPVERTYYYPAGNTVWSQSSTPKGAGIASNYFAYTYTTDDIAADDSQWSLQQTWSGNGAIAAAINKVPGALTGPYFVNKYSKAQANNMDFRSTFKEQQAELADRVTVK